MTRPGQSLTPALTRLLPHGKAQCSWRVAAATAADESEKSTFLVSLSGQITSAAGHGGGRRCGRGGGVPVAASGLRRALAETTASRARRGSGVAAVTRVLGTVDL